MVTLNARRLLDIERALAAHMAGDVVLRSGDLKVYLAERRRIIDHLASGHMCPTCGHALDHDDVVAAMPSIPV